MMSTMNQVNNAIRHPYAWPGGYPVYVILTDGVMLCHQCAKENYCSIAGSTRRKLQDGWQAAGADILYEGEEYCGHCGKRLESAYGEGEQCAL